MNFPLRNGHSNTSLYKYPRKRHCENYICILILDKINLGTQRWSLITLHMNVYRPIYKQWCIVVGSILFTWSLKANKYSEPIALTRIMPRRTCSSIPRRPYPVSVFDTNPKKANLTHSPYIGQRWSYCVHVCL